MHITLAFAPPMTDEIRFDDGAGYERYMGVWSQRVGVEFLHWLASDPGRQWLDIGCGNGVFTELICERCAPTSVLGIDPSEAQIAFARERAGARDARFEIGDALALPTADASIDVAVMPLVIFFLSDPARGVREMARVLRPGGIACAYAWDMEGEGFPYATLFSALGELGAVVPSPPHPEASRLDALETLWTDGGFAHVDTTVITVERTFEDLEDYWATVQQAPSARRVLGAASGIDHDALRALLVERLATGRDGRITCTGRAHAIRGVRRPAPRPS